MKAILCSGICLLYITALTAQVPAPKNKTLSNVAGYQLYQLKLWNTKQLPKNSVLYQYNSKYYFHHGVAPNKSLRLSPITIHFITHTSARPLSISEPVPYLSTLEKLQLHLQKSSFESYYLPQQFSCWVPVFLKRYKASFSNTTFFKYQ